MKKIIALIGIMVLTALTSSAFADDKIGYVNVPLVMQKYNKSKEATVWVQKQEKSLETFLAKAKKDIESKPANKRVELEKKYNKELSNKINTFNKNREAKIQQVASDVEVAIAEVGKNGGYTIIVPATMALYGGIDCTNEVIKVLNTKKK